jgi:hypothetical protein
MEECVSVLRSRIQALRHGALLALFSDDPVEADRMRRDAIDLIGFARDLALPLDPLGLPHYPENGPPTDDLPRPDCR